MSTHTCNIDIPGLSDTATRGHIFAKFAHALLSIPVLADHGCTTPFTCDAVIVTLKDVVILQGYRDRATGMWTVPLTPSPPLDSPPPTAPTEQRANSAYHTRGKKELVMQAIQAGNYTTWPELEPSLVTKHLPKSSVTVKGHLHGQRQNV
jgi:hypothetical protein